MGSVERGSICFPLLGTQPRDVGRSGRGGRVGSDGHRAAYLALGFFGFLLEGILNLVYIGPFPSIIRDPEGLVWFNWGSFLGESDNCGLTGWLVGYMTTSASLGF